VTDEQAAETESRRAWARRRRATTIPPPVAVCWLCEGPCVEDVSIEVRGERHIVHGACAEELVDVIVAAVEGP
jgi:hypothetical protein